MSYIVLARKWRPKDFDQVVGQPATVLALKGALAQNRIHHAYLFTGTRGVGKTTLARIIAKALNCEAGITANPCNQCNTCKAIDEGRFVDVIEVDAASKTKVEDTRELLDNVAYAPSQARFKIYIIDEVHMLSNHSFNALLKTLEEPPAHVKFLLATTDPQKLPITIMSRCLQFHLQPLSQDNLEQHLAAILQAENISYAPAALSLLAQAGQGSVRDALSLLEQAVAYGQGHISLENVETFLGVVSQALLINILYTLQAQDAKTLWQWLEKLKQQGIDPQEVLNNFIKFIYSLSLAQILPETLPQNNYTSDLKKLAQGIAPEALQLYYQIALLGKRDWVYVPDPQIALEMIFLRMLHFNPVLEVLPDMELPSVKNNLPSLEQQIQGNQVGFSAKLEQSSIPSQAPVISESQVTSETSTSEPVIPESQVISEPAPVTLESQTTSEPEQIIPKQNESVDIASELHKMQALLQSNDQNTNPIAKEENKEVVIIQNDKTLDPSLPLDISTLNSENWLVLGQHLALTGPAAELLRNGVFSHQQENTIYLLLHPLLGHVLSNIAKQTLIQALSNYFKKDIQLIIDYKEHNQQTLAEWQLLQDKAQQNALEQEVLQDPGIQLLQQLFDAKIENIIKNN